MQAKRNLILKSAHHKQNNKYLEIVEDFQIYMQQLPQLMFYKVC